MEAGRLFNEKESLKSKIMETNERANKAEAMSTNLQNIISSNEHKVSFYDNVLKVDEGMVSLDEANKRLAAFGKKIPCNVIVMTDKGIVNLVEAIKGKLMDVFCKYGNICEDEEIDDSPY